MTDPTSGRRSAPSARAFIAVGIIVLAAGREFRKLGAYPMGELVMATPAVAEGTMYVRGVSTLFAIGRAN